MYAKTIYAITLQAPTQGTRPLMRSHMPTRVFARRYVCGLAHAARVGILVKGGKHLEVLAKIQVSRPQKALRIPTSAPPRLENLDSVGGRDRENTIKQFREATSGPAGNYFGRW